jgi:xanthosine utilization system XapX-like protein
MSTTPRDHHFIAGAGYIALVVLIVGFLVTVDIPANNAPLANTLLGVLIGGIAPSVTRLLGKGDEELAKQRSECDERIAELQHDLALITEAHKALKAQHDRLVAMLVQQMPLANGTRVKDFSDTLPAEGLFGA